MGQLHETRTRPVNKQVNPLIH